MDNNHDQAGLEIEYGLYFYLLKQKINQYHIEPCHTYNLGEKAFSVGTTGHSKRVYSRKIWEKNQVKQTIRGGNHEWVSVVACVCADGSQLMPSLIYQSASGAIQRSWVEGMESADYPAHITTSPSGLTDHYIGLLWLEQVFDRYTRGKAQRSYRLLILDSHKSHVNRDFQDYCNRNRILLMICPPHSAHTLSPLDGILFKSLSIADSKEVSASLENSQELSPIETGDFFPLFWKAWVSSVTESTILKSFEATGISPINPDAILRRFSNANSGEQGPIGSSTTVIGVSNLEEFDQCVKIVGEEINNKEVKKLLQKVRSVFIRNEGLYLEGKRLREALATKEERRRRGPRYRQILKERREKKLILHDDKPSKLKRAERAQQEAERDRQQQARNTQMAPQSSRKGDRNALQSPDQNDNRKKQVVDAIDGGQALGVASAFSPKITRYGRNVKVPDRYN